MTIKSPDYNKFGETRTYFTAHDPVVQEIYANPKIERYTPERLKITALLNDTVTVAGTHIIRSERTYEQLLDNRALLESGIVVPAINDDFNSLIDMADQKISLDQYEDPWRPGGSLATSTVLDRGRHIDKYTDMYMGWDIGDMRGTFKKSMLRDIKDPDSRLYRNLSTEVEIDQLSSLIEEVTPFSRRGLLNSTDFLSDRARELLFDHINTNYHLTGARIHQANPSVPSREINTLRNKFHRAVEIDPESPPPTIQKHHIEGKYLSPDVAFQELLDALCIGIHTIRRLDTNEIVDMHDERITRRFRSSLQNLFDEIHGNNEGKIHEFRTIQDEFVEEVEKRVYEGKHRMQKAKKVIQTTVYASSIGSTITYGNIEDVTIAILDPIIRWLVERDQFRGLVGNEFFAVSQKLKERSE